MKTLLTPKADDETRYLAQMREQALKFKRIEIAAVEKRAHDEGREEGRKEGRAEGELIGKICLAQQMLKQSVDSPETLGQKSLTELQQIFAELQARLHLK